MVESAGVDAGSSGASCDAPSRAILAAKAFSTCLASAAERRFLAFRMATARGCKVWAGVFWISSMSRVLAAAESPVLSSSWTGRVVGYR